MLKILFSLALLSALAPTVVEGCSGAADRKSLDTLKKYLGIDYVDRLLFGGNTTYSETEYITRPGDLNCDFERPELCRWSNYRSSGTDARDQVDWFLFTQTDKKRWPGAFTPGTPPAQGTQFIIAGDKSKKPSSAIFYSSPIRCQKSGELSFNYLLYSSAKVEVLVLRPRTDPVEIMAPTIAVNCPKFVRKRRGQVVRCRAAIPDIQEPFQLGIRAHSLKNSLAVVDDIEYTGDICSGSSDLVSPTDTFDLGPSRVHSSGLTGRLISNKAEVSCSAFDAGCRWGNARGQTDNWVVQTTPPDLNQWRKQTGTAVTPSAPYLALVSNGETGDMVSASFVTDPMACQRGVGRVTLRYWVTALAEVEVCAVAYRSLSKFECERLGRAGSPGPRTVTISGPINEEFFLSVEGVVPPEGGFVAIDDVSYDADICSAALAPATQAPASVGDILRGLTTSSLSGGLTGEPVEFPDDLFCDFASESVGFGDSEYKCQWGNGARGRGGQEWVLVDGEVDPDLLERTTGTPFGPQPPFSAAEFGPTGGVASLLSDHMNCQTTKGSLTLSYWLSDGVELRVCPVSASTGRRLNPACPVLARGPTSAERVSVPIPAAVRPINTPFKIEIEATSAKEGFALIDDVEYEGELCSSAPAIPTTQSPVSKSVVAACKLLKCSVDGNSLCNFESFPTRVGDPRFVVEDRAIGGAQNIMVGTRYPEPYIGTLIARELALTGQRSTGGQVAVLRSQKFRLARGTTATLRFKHQRSTVGSQLWYCHNMFNRDIETIPLSQQRSCFRVSGGDDVSEIKGVTTAAIPITSATNRVILVAYHPELERRGAASFLLDDLSLTTTDGAELC